MDWLERVPQALVEAHLDMIDGLKAEDAMSLATATAIGGRGLKHGSWMSNQWRSWGRSALARTRPVKATPGDLGAIGVGVRVKSRG